MYKAIQDTRPTGIWGLGGFKPRTVCMAGLLVLHIPGQE